MFFCVGEEYNGSHEELEPSGNSLYWCRNPGTVRELLEVTFQCLLGVYKQLWRTLFKWLENKEKCMPYMPRWAPTLQVTL